MLSKRDRERYRSALKDIKDYEIYKEVMEAAMIRSSPSSYIVLLLYCLGFNRNWSYMQKKIRHDIIILIIIVITNCIIRV